MARKRSTAEQLAYFVNYMSTHIAFANGEYGGPLGAKKHQEEWIRLTELLSEKGPDKSVEQWKQTWRDMKRKARADIALATKNQTGDAAPLIKITPTIEKVLSVIGTDASDGISPLGSFLKNGVDPLDDSMSSEESFPEEAHNIKSENSTPLVPGSQFATPSVVTKQLASFQDSNCLLSELVHLTREGNSIQKRQNSILQERNAILRERNALLRERNKILKRKVFKKIVITGI